MKKLKIISTLAILLVITGCSTMKASFTREGKFYKTAENYYLSGDYISAVVYLSKSLQIDPDYEQAYYLLEDSHNKSKIQIQNLEYELSNSSRKFINHEYLDLYIDVMEMYDDYNRVEGIKNKNYEYNEKVAIYREKTALDYYNAALDESSGNDLESEYKCFEYLNKACEVWGEEYLDSYTVAAEYIYNKGLRIAEGGTRESYIKASRELEKVGEWVKDYKDSSKLIISFLEKSKSYYIVIGDDVVSNKLDKAISKVLSKQDKELSIYSLDNSTAVKYQLENSIENFIIPAFEYGISNVVQLEISNIEYIDPYKEARFAVERKRFWIDEMDQPVKEVNEELLEQWEDDEDLRITFLENDGITGYRDFNYTYILNSLSSSIKVTVTINVFNTSSGILIGSENQDFTYIDTVTWLTDKKGHPDIFKQVLTEDIDHRPVYNYDKLLLAVKENINLVSLSEKVTKLIMEDNPLSKKIDD